MFEDKKPFSRIQIEADGARSTRISRKIIPPILGVLISIFFIVYVVALLIGRHGSFTVSAKDSNDRTLSLSLSETADFKKSTSRLTASEAVNIDNIAGESLPEGLNDRSGSNNGENYLCYTFYIKNAGEKACTFDWTLMVTRATAGIDEAVRVRVYWNPEYYKAETDTTTYANDYTDYAREKRNSGGEQEVNNYGTMTNFESESVIETKRTDNFAPGDVARMTVVIWLEGNDPDCTDDILGGQFKVDMVAEIVGASE